MDLGLDGRSCAVTGASRGIGLATARRLAAEGASLLLVARSERGLAAAAEECEREARERPGASLPAADAPAADGEPESEGRPPVAATLALDVTEPDAGERIVAEAERHFGRLDVLVNNAGWSRLRELEEVPDADWQAQFEISVMAPLRAMRAAVPAMAERGWGRVVNVSSTAGKRPSARMPDYSVGKAAELSLSRLFADRYAAAGVLVNAVAPGPTRSEMWTAEGGLGDQARELDELETREQAEAAMASKRPIGRFAEVEEIAEVICFLCSERASYVSGAAWGVDGGTVPVII